MKIDILHNRFILFFILIVAFGNLVFQTKTGDWQFVMVFILTGVLTSFFSKNMTIILTISMAVANALQLTNTNLKVTYEGMERRPASAPTTASKNKKTTTENMEEKAESEAEEAGEEEGEEADEDDKKTKGEVNDIVKNLNSINSLLSGVLGKVAPTNIPSVASAPKESFTSLTEAYSKGTRRSL